MIDFGEGQYRDLCRAGRVRLEIDTIEEKRKAAIRMFSLTLLVGLALAALIGWAAIASGLGTFGPFLGLAGALVALVLALRPLGQAGRGLKLPVLETLAGMGELDYAPDTADPPVYREARDVLFGKWLSSEAFTDLFQGTDAEGRRYAFYEANLMRKSGKSSTVVFSGQIYAFERHGRSGAPIAIVPDRGIFNFFKPQKGMERVKFESDPEFEKKFEIYAVHAHEAQLLLGSDLRRKLLDWRQGGRVLAFIGPGHAFIAITGSNRFEAGSMFRSRPGEERVRTMFDDVRASLATLRSLKASLG